MLKSLSLKKSSGNWILQARGWYVWSCSYEPPEPNVEPKMVCENIFKKKKREPWQKEFNTFGVFLKKAFVSEIDSELN